jgi:hypothetical protein
MYGSSQFYQVLQLQQESSEVRQASSPLGLFRQKNVPDVRNAYQRQITMLTVKRASFGGATDAQSA